MGSVGQLLVYLARYAFVRLEASGLSLHVNQAVMLSADLSASPDRLQSVYRLASWNVGDLMQVLGAYPPETPLLVPGTDSTVPGTKSDGRAAIIYEHRDLDGQLSGLVVATQPDGTAHREESAIKDQPALGRTP